MGNISRARVEAQLEKILASPDFGAGKRSTQFLRWVAEEALNGRSATIKQSTIATEALGYGADFDPQTNPIVRIHARQVRRALEHYYFTEGSGDPLRIEMPKGGYVPVFLENGTAAVAPSPANPSTAAAETSTAPLQPTLAVVMFECLNSEAGCGHIATGLTEEIIIALARFPGFVVTGPLSRSVLGEQDLDTDAVGHRYGVRFILDGTVRTKERAFRLTIRLADAASGRQLWGEVLDSSLEDDSAMDFGRSVVDRVVSTIAENHGVIPSTMLKESLARRSSNRSSYEALLHFYHYIRVLTKESFVNALDALELAVRNDPHDAPANAVLSDLLVCCYVFGFTDDASILDRAEALGRKAGSLDPGSQAAHLALAMVHFSRFERTLFLKEAEHARRLNPNNANYLASLAVHTAMAGESERARELMDKAMLLNPHHTGWYHIVAFMDYYRRGKYDRALIAARLFNTQDFYWDPLIRAAALGQLGRRAEGERAVRELLVMVPDFARRGLDLIRRLAFLDEHVDMLAEGLSKAGLDVKAAQPSLRSATKPRLPARAENQPSK